MNCKVNKIFDRFRVTDVCQYKITADFFGNSKTRLFCDIPNDYFRAFCR
ncbi:hypothetical protein EMIT0P253_10262 [Pseudomonas sp. IT-P253]